MKKSTLIYRKIKEFDKIVIARHIGPDPDALGSSIGLKEIIKSSFPKKEVYTIGASPSKFKYMGKVDKVSEEFFEDSLLIVLDTPDLKRIDGINDVTKFKYIIKIDHHPSVDVFADIEWVDDTESSASQMILELVYETRLKLTKYAAERLFMGIVSDTNRFLFYYTTSKTMSLVSRLIKDTNIDFTSLYDDMYARPLSEIRLQGYMYQNIIVTENGFAYLKLTDEILKKFEVEPASSGNLVNNFNNINDVYVWVVFTEDIKQGLIRVNARSRGPIINKVLERYNGGGHKFASGARLKEFSDMENLIEDLDKLCKEYKKTLKN